MGVIWHVNVGAPAGADGAPTPTSRAGEGPDDVVRPGTCRSQATGSYDPTSARRCGCRGLLPPETVSRIAAPADGDHGRTGNVRDRLAALLLGRDPVQPHSQW
jgi:hypothetical protein